MKHQARLRFALLVFAVNLAAALRSAHALATRFARAAGHWSAPSCAARLLPLLLLLPLPAAGQARFVHTTRNGTITITGYDCESGGGAVTIPGTIDGLPVTRIGDHVFSGCTSLSAITIPDSVTSIGNAAFSGTGLTGVTIPDRVTKISDHTFYSCGSLTNVTIPGSVISIGNAAFYYCQSLTGVTIPLSVASIGSYAFSGCDRLTAIAVDPLNSAFASLDGVLFNQSQTTLLQYPGGKAGSYTIPDRVTSIGEYSFSGCTGLTSVSIPDSVTRIGDGAFSGSSLSSVTIPDSITRIENSVFSECHSLTNVTIPDSVTRIEDYAFSGCGSLTTLTLPNTVTHIGNYAFYGCSGLTRVTIGSGITNIAGLASESWPSLTEFTVDALSSSFRSMDGVLFNQDQTTLVRFPQGKTGSYTIPDSVTSIEEYSFSGCTGLANVTIPGSVTFIGNSAFAGCAGLASVTIPASVASIGDAAFAGCSNLSAITVAALNSAYRSVEGVLFNQSQTTLLQYPGGKAGRYPIPGSVTSLGNSAFSGCAGLTSVTIPDGVISIGRGAFGGCTGLTSLTIPASVSFVGNGACAGCIHLTEALFKGNAPIVEQHALGGYHVFEDTVVYRQSGTIGWDTTFAARPTKLWDPEVLTLGASRVRADRFGFNLIWAGDRVVVIEAATELVNSVWVPLQTNTLTGDASYFSDPRWADYPTRFYRVISPVP